MLQRKHENDPQNTGVRKGATVTIVKKKVIELQHLFLPSWAPWYSMSFLREGNDFTVTIWAEKLELRRC